MFCSEPPVTGRTDDNIDDDTKGEEQELVINAEGDKEIEDKNSRPCSGQVFKNWKCSDLVCMVLIPKCFIFISTVSFNTAHTKLYV